MSYAIRAGFALTVIAVIMTVPAVVPPAAAQSNPYRRVEGTGEPPPDMNGGEWGELIGVDIDPQGNVWVLHRCFKGGAWRSSGGSRPLRRPDCQLLRSVGLSPTDHEIFAVRGVPDELRRGDVR